MFLPALVAVRGTPGDGLVAPAATATTAGTALRARARGHHRQPDAGLPPHGGSDPDHRLRRPTRRRAVDDCQDVRPSSATTRCVARRAGRGRRRRPPARCRATHRRGAGFPPVGDLEPGRDRAVLADRSSSCCSATKPASTGSAYTPWARASSAARRPSADGRARTFLPYVPQGRRAGEGRAGAADPALPAVRRGRLARATRALERTLSVGGRLEDLVEFAASAGSTPVTWLVDPAVPDAIPRLAAGNPPLSLGPTVAPPTDEEPDESPSGDPSETADPDGGRSRNVSSPRRSRPPRRPRVLAGPVRGGGAGRRGARPPVRRPRRGRGRRARPRPLRAGPRPPQHLADRPGRHPHADGRVAQRLPQRRWLRAAPRRHHGAGHRPDVRARPPGRRRRRRQDRRPAVVRRRRRRSPTRRSLHLTPAAPADPQRGRGAAAESRPPPAPGRAAARVAARRRQCVLLRPRGRLARAHHRGRRHRPRRHRRRPRGARLPRDPAAPPARPTVVRCRRRPDLRRRDPAEPADPQHRGVGDRHRPGARGRVLRLPRDADPGPDEPRSTHTLDRRPARRRSRSAPARASRSPEATAASRP